MYMNMEEATLARIRPSQMIHYLAAHGWALKHTLPDRFAIHVLPGNAEAEVNVPLRPDYRAYTRRMAEAISDMALFQQGCVQTILQEVLAVVEEEGQTSA